MIRIIAIALSLTFLSLQGFSSPLSVEVPNDLWPQWLRLFQTHPLPAGVQAIRSQPESEPGWDRVILSLETVGKVIGFMPMVPVATLGHEQSLVTLDEVTQGKIQVLPLCDVSLPQVALPLEGLLPDEPGYPLFQKVAVRLESSSPELQAWYSNIVEQAHPPSGREAGITWIEAVGDIMPARGVDRTLLSDGGLERVFGNTLPVLRAADLVLGNLESSAAQRGQPENKSYTFRFRGAAVQKLRDAGFSYLSLANNHTFDFGAEGFLQTLAALTDSGVLTSGAGRNLQQASEPSIFRLADQEVRVLSFGAFPADKTGFDGRISEKVGDTRPGILWLDEQGLAVADHAFQASSFNIAFVHGGQEWRTTPTPEQKELYRDLIRHGATLVLGAHPHVLQGMEAFQGGLIVYSLGNFLFPGMDGTPGGQDSIIVRLGLYEGSVRYVQAIPVHLNGATVRKAQDDSALKDMMARTRALEEVSAKAN